MLAALLPIMGTLTMLPVMPLLFSHFAAQPHAQLLVPMIITIPAASMALLAPLAGMVGDRLSRRRLLIAATALYAGFGLLPVMLDDLYAILLARLVMGIADAFILTTANALIGDYFTGEACSKWLAVQSGMGSILSTLIVLGAGLLGTTGLVWSDLPVCSGDPGLYRPVSVHRRAGDAPSRGQCRWRGGCRFSTAQNGDDRPDYPRQRDSLLSRAAADKRCSVSSG